MKKTAIIAIACLLLAGTVPAQVFSARQPNSTTTNNFDSTSQKKEQKRAQKKAERKMKRERKRANDTAR